MTTCTSPNPTTTWVNSSPTWNNDSSWNNENPWDDDLILQKQSSTISEEISSVLTEKTRELFYMCDPSNKGYVTKDDLYRLQDELGLNDSDVEKAFKQLDTDNDKYLTLEEFTKGFGLFLGVENPTTTTDMVTKTTTTMTDNGIDTELKPDFVFQVFNLVDHDDKGYITKNDLIECSTTLEMQLWQIDQWVEKVLKFRQIEGEGMGEIYFDDFAGNIESLVSISPALQEVMEAEERRKMVGVKRNILKNIFKMDVSSHEDCDVERALTEEATALFKLCDGDRKSYVTQDDLLTLSNELALSRERILQTFSILDKNGHGYITLREFINGFHTFFDLVTDGDAEYLNETSSRYKKAEELFHLCDRDEKGYVTKQDLDCLVTKIGLPEQQLLTIFQQLDKDENGLISLEEFVDGFLQIPEELQNNKNNISNCNEEVYENCFEEMYLTDCRTSSNSGTTRYNNNTTTTTRGLASGSQMESESSAEDKHSLLLRQPSVKYEHSLGEVINKMEEEVGSGVTAAQLEDLRDIVSRCGDAMSVSIFEEFLGRVYNELKDAKEEAKHLETVLERKSMTHNEEIKKIYDEMEQHLHNEKLKVQEMENRRESHMLEDVQNELQEKQLQLDKYLQRQQTLEERLRQIQEKEQLLKTENSELLKENVILENKLNTSMDHMEALRSNLHRMEEQTSLEKKETLRAAVQATQGLQHEHESLVRELDLLRITNERLRDDRDALELSLKGKTHRAESWADEVDALTQTTKGKVQRTESVMSKYVQPAEPRRLCPKLSRSPDSSGSNESLNGSERSRSGRSLRNKLNKQGSLMSTYFEPIGNHQHSPILQDDDDVRPSFIRNISVDEPSNSDLPTRSRNVSAEELPLTTIGEAEEDGNSPRLNRESSTPIPIQRGSSRESTSSMNRSSPKRHRETSSPTLIQKRETSSPTSTQNQDSACSTPISTLDDLRCSTPVLQRTPSSPRQTPVGRNAEDDDVGDSLPSVLGSSPEHPSRLYKLVLVGDSCVGKSTFIHRFCFNSFKTFGATIGVDFQVKTMKINHEYIALQLWDTAGQERFRSMTKSYFRRADGVIVMFDLSSEESYLNVKGWMQNIEEGAESDCIVMLLGNKLDLIENDKSVRKVEYDMASRLAKEYNAFYYEVSACSGYNVKESIEILASNVQIHGNGSALAGKEPRNEIRETINGSQSPTKDQVSRWSGESWDRKTYDLCNEGLVHLDRPRLPANSVSSCSRRNSSCSRRLSQNELINSNNPDSNYNNTNKIKDNCHINNNTCNNNDNINNNCYNNNKNNDDNNKVNININNGNNNSNQNLINGTNNNEKAETCSRILYDMRTVKEISTSAVKAVMQEFSTGMTERNDSIKSTICQMNDRYLKLEGLVNARLERIENEWKNYMEENRELEEERNAENENLVLLQEELSRKSEVIDLLNEKLDCFTAELARKNEETEKLQNELKSSKKERKTKSSDTDAMKSQIADLEQQLRTITEQNSSLTASVQNKDEQISNLQGGIVNLNRNLGESCGEVRRLEESVKRLENIIKMNSNESRNNTRKESRDLYDHDVIMVHDAVLNHVTTGFLRAEGLNVRKIWGPNLKKTYETILTLKSLPKTVLIHTGTYDLEKLSEKEIVDWIEKIYFCLHYRGVKTIFSAIIPRNDQLDAKGQLVNAMVANKFSAYDDFFVCRNDNLLGIGGVFNENYYDDSVHVNSEDGARLLETNIKHAVARSLGIEVVTKTKTKSNKKKKYKRKSLKNS